MARRLVTIICAECGIHKEIPHYRYNDAVNKRGQSKFFCSIKCVASHNKLSHEEAALSKERNRERDRRRYQKNREKIRDRNNAIRRKMWEENEEYREKVKAASKAYKRKTRAAKLGEYGEAYKAFLSLREVFLKKTTPEQRKKIWKNQQTS